MSSDFIDAVREADWPRAHSLVERGNVSPVLDVPSASIFTWLVELDAPPQLVVDLLRSCGGPQLLDRTAGQLMETCLRESLTKVNAFETFALLLENGVSPNLIVNGGTTLLQTAMALNRLREVEELIRHGVDASQKSVFGRESTTNLDEARTIGNEAAQLVLTKFAPEG